MTTFFFVNVFIIASFLTVFLYRSVIGPTVFDRLIGLFGISISSIILLLMVGMLYGRLDMFIDIALGYGLLNLVGSLAIGKYLERRGLR